MENEKILKTVVNQHKNPSFNRSIDAEKTTRSTTSPMHNGDPTLLRKTGDLVLPSHADDSELAGYDFNARATTIISAKQHP
jgi:hypothetical protein